MDTTLLFEFSIDRENKTINVKREFSAGREKVWAAWTQSELLDKWWAPKPWKCETTSMDFKVGGRWLYTMVGPKGEKQYSLADYESIDPQKAFRNTMRFVMKTETLILICRVPTGL